jgi:hypothetical protein
MAGLSKPFRYPPASKGAALQPQEGNPPGLGSSAFARRYLRNRFFFLFLQVLRCFSSLGYPRNLGIDACLSAPPSISQTSTPLLLTPRHPPCALSNLTAIFPRPRRDPNRDSTRLFYPNRIYKTRTFYQTRTAARTLAENRQKTPATGSPLQEETSPDGSRLCREAFRFRRFDRAAAEPFDP